MNNQVVYKLVEEVRLQCRWGKLAYENLRASLQAVDMDKTFFYAQALMGQAARVSRLLWPARATSKARGEQLRAELKVTEASPLNLRELRPRLEAADEHLEDWIGTLEAPTYRDFNVMAQGTMSAFKQDTFQWNLDPDTYKVVFRGEPCDLRRLAEELQRVESAAHVWLRTHNPW